MAEDSRGRAINAGKRTRDADVQHYMYRQRMRGGLPDGMTWDISDPEVWRAYHSASDTLARNKTAGFFDPYQNPTNMWSKESGIRMMKNAFEDPDTAHISLSNDEYM